MQPVSTYSSLLAQTNVMTSTSQLSQKLSYELSSGKKAVDLADNPDRQTILDLTLTKNSREAYVKSCTLASTTVSQYDSSLNYLEDIIKKSLKTVQGLRTTYQGISSNPATAVDKSQASNTQTAYIDMGLTINQIMVETQIGLNEPKASGNGYLFAGLRTPTSAPVYTLPPVSDLTNLPYFLGDVPAAPPGSTIAGYAPPFPGPAVDPTTTAASLPLPTYDADFLKVPPPFPLPSQLAQAWGTQKVTIEDTETLNINITSTHPAFQNLINGLRAAKTAADQCANYSTTVRDQYMDLSYAYLNRALNGGLDPTTNTWVVGIRSLVNQNLTNQETLQTKTDYHNTDLSVLNTRLDTLIGVDTTDVTVRLATANNQLQASYKATASLLSMSLMNYLK